MKPEEIKGYNNPDLPWRDRPIEESLKLFDVSNNNNNNNNNINNNNNNKNNNRINNAPFPKGYKAPGIITARSGTKFEI